MMIKLLIIAIMFTVACVPYTKKDKYLLGAVWVTCLADYYQTNRILEDNDFEEGNGMIQNDTDAAVFMLGMPLALTIGGLWIPPKDRAVFFGTIAGIKGGVVAYNYDRGVR